MDVEPSVHLAIGIEKLLTSGLYSDITFKSGDGDSTPAHRCILASFSPVFSTMLSSGLQEQATATITIADMTTAELRAFLAFLYTGHLERHEVADFGPAVLAACHKYCLPPPLKDACVTGLCRSVTPENCLALLELAELYGEKTLASKCRSVGSRLINVWFRRYNTQKSRLLSIVVPAAGTVAEIVSEVNKQLNRSSRIKASLRILQVSDHRIGRIFNKRDPISIISQAESNNESLRAEEVPPDEEKCVPGKYVLHVHHFRNGTWSYEAFGEPFAMNVHHLGEMEVCQVPDHPGVG